MIIVADSSPFVVLVAVECVDVLAALFEEVLIPPQVESELRHRSVSRRFELSSRHHRPGSGSSPPIPSNASRGFTPVKPPLSHWPGNFGRTESSSTRHLAERAATQRGLQVIGTIGVLETAADRGFIDLGHAFEKVKKTDFWVSPTFLDERHALFLERKK